MKTAIALVNIQAGKNMPSKKDEQISALLELVKEKQSLEAAVRQADKAISRIQKLDQYLTRLTFQVFMATNDRTIAIYSSLLNNK